MSTTLVEVTTNGRWKPLKCKKHAHQTTECVRDKVCETKRERKHFSEMPLSNCIQFSVEKRRRTKKIRCNALWEFEIYVWAITKDNNDMIPKAANTTETAHGKWIRKKSVKWLEIYLEIYPIASLSCVTLAFRECARIDRSQSF